MASKLYLTTLLGDRNRQDHFGILQVSLLLLTFMSVERFVSISHPFGERTLNYRTASISTALIWLTGSALAVVPVLYWNELGSHHGSNGLCFPLHIHEPSALGWQYSAFLYIGINGSW